MESPTVFVVIIVILALITLIAVAALLFLLFRRRDGINLPPGLSADNIVPLPGGANQREAMTKLEQAMDESGINSEEYVVARVAISDGGNFYTAPTIVNYDTFEDGTIVGVLWDVNNVYGKGSLVYQVRVSGKTVVLFNKQSEVSIVRDDVRFAEPDVPAFCGSAMFFVEGSCWWCGWIDRRYVCVGCS